MKRLAILLTSATVACGSAVPTPVDFDTRHEVCRFCRMSASDGLTAAQLVSYREDPMFFDDIGCLRDYLKRAGPAAPGTAAFVTDHRTREWIRADSAVYTLVQNVRTPMESHLFAHASDASRDRDAEIRGGKRLSFDEVFDGTGLGEHR